MRVVVSSMFATITDWSPSACSSTNVPPAHVLAAFALSFLLGYFVNFMLNFLMNCVAFWTLETFAVQLVVRWV
ncbi:MAG: hypothetical protein QOF71_1775, partial [Candidatus Eremiobacteraeota bacterium]|nr:hypothetical protein [Candidatus Eremiobacteraeota bacterium]